MTVAVWMVSKDEAGGYHVDRAPHGDVVACFNEAGDAEGFVLELGVEPQLHEEAHPMFKPRKPFNGPEAIAPGWTLTDTGAVRSDGVRVAPGDGAAFAILRPDPLGGGAYATARTDRLLEAVAEADAMFPRNDHPRPQ